MWLATKKGFYSVVESGEQKGKYLIRSRSRKDLLNLFPRGRVIDTPDADYGFRVIVDRKELGIFMSDLAESVNYPNFKDSLKSTNQSDKLPFYMKIWSVMFQYQYRKGYGGK